MRLFFALTTVCFTMNKTMSYDLVFLRLGFFAVGRSHDCHPRNRWTNTGRLCMHQSALEISFTIRYIQCPKSLYLSHEFRPLRLPSQYPRFPLDFPYNNPGFAFGVFGLLFLVYLTDTRYLPPSFTLRIPTRISSLMAQLDS
jgi:hypothetical protein